MGISPSHIMGISPSHRMTRELLLYLVNSRSNILLTLWILRISLLLAAEKTDRSSRTTLPVRSKSTCNAPSLSEKLQGLIDFLACMLKSDSTPDSSTREPPKNACNSYQVPIRRIITSPPLSYTPAKLSCILVPKTLRERSQRYTLKSTYIAPLSEFITRAVNTSTTLACVYLQTTLPFSS